MNERSPKCSLEIAATEEFARLTKVICTVSLLGPGRVQNDLHEIAPTEARYEVLRDVRLYVAEGRRLRLRSDAVGERLEDAALEVRTWMQRSDLGPLAVTDVVIADAQHVVLHTGGDQRDLGFHELRDTRAGVQGDGRPHAPDAVLGDAVTLQELARSATNMRGRLASTANGSPKSMPTVSAAALNSTCCDR